MEGSTDAACSFTIVTRFATGALLRVVGFNTAFF
jgi:hypothetical protein